MGRKIADKADPRHELSVTMGAGTAAELLGETCSSPFGPADSLLLRDGSATGDAAAKSRAILCDALPALRVNV